MPVGIHDFQTFVADCHIVLHREALFRLLTFGHIRPSSLVGGDDVGGLDAIQIGFQDPGVGHLPTRTVDTSVSRHGIQDIADHAIADLASDIRIDVAVPRSVDTVVQELGSAVDEDGTVVGDSGGTWLTVAIPVDPEVGVQGGNGVAHEQVGEAHLGVGTGVDDVDLPEIEGNYLNVFLGLERGRREDLILDDCHVAARSMSAAANTSIDERSTHIGAAQVFV